MKATRVYFGIGLGLIMGGALGMAQGQYGPGAIGVFFGLLFMYLGYMAWRDGQ